MISDNIRKELEELITSTLTDVFIVDMRLIKGKGNILSVKADTDSGITLQQCSRISRIIGAHLEEHPDFDFPYTLEVSSPGIGTPLKLKRQYQKEIGRHLQVRLTDQTEFKGTLSKVDEDQIEVIPLPKKKKKKNDEVPSIYHILFNDIEEAKVIII